MRYIEFGLFSYQLDDIDRNKDIKKNGDKTPGAKSIRIPLIGSREMCLLSR